ncbi:MAG: hypothetical protein QOF85_2357 [Solirubrobacterales bacterium]|jgi:hypothetical protein|nr:hypothetical protein [Solirubrobacterales bacterium]
MKLTPRLERLVLMARAFDSANRALADVLRTKQFEAELNLEAPTSAEVRLGLASRQLRLLSYVAGNPMLWHHPVGEYFLRPMVDTRILATWLIARNDPELFEKFKSFGAGRLKLHKLHLEDFVEDEELHGEFEGFLDYLDKRINSETLEEFQSVDLSGNFSGISIRDMAIQAGLKRLYDLHYAPLSAELHGEWQSLEEWDLGVSDDPLHQSHRFGTFDAPQEGVAIQIVGHAFFLMADTVTEIFTSLGLDIGAEIETCGVAFTAAIKRARESTEAESDR